MMLIRRLLFFVILSAALAAPFVALADEAETALCPVCRVHEGETEQEEIRAVAEFDGESYGFCSEKCRDTFLEDPVAYLPPVFPRPAPDFSIEALDGSPAGADRLDDRVTLLDFWATWCPPCVDDLPRLTALHQRWQDKGFQVVGVSIDEGEAAPRKVARMVKRKKVEHPILLDGGNDSAWAAYRVRVVPTQYLIDRQGRIVAQWSGKIDLDLVEARIAELLDESTSTPAAK